MLATKLPSLLAPSAAARLLAPASFALLRALTHASPPTEGTTIAEWKAVASGDPGKEWVTGSIKDGAGVTRKLRLGTDELFEGAKRGAQQVTEVAREVAEAKIANGHQAVPSTWPADLAETDEPGHSA